MSSSVDEEYLDKLISALQKYPDYRDKILGILQPSDFVKRDELNETLTEIKQLRFDFNSRFEEQQQEIKLLRSDFNSRFEEQQQNFNTRFDEQQQEIKLLRSDFNSRFEEQQQNFNSRFEKQQQEIKQLRSDFNSRFEEQQQNFNSRFQALEQSIKHLIQEMNKGFASIRGELAEFSTKYGYQRESEARKLLKEFLKSKDISPSKIKHHQIIDEDGIVFGKDYITEIDAYYDVDGDSTWVFEFKAKVDDRDVFHFNKVVELFEKGYNKEVSRKIVTCFDITEKATEDAKLFDIEIWKNVREDPILLKPSDLD